MLAGAERKLGVLGEKQTVLFRTPEQEGIMLTNTLIQGWQTQKMPEGHRRVNWDARRTIKWMMENEITNGPFQNEWQGFYWEAKGRQLLNAAFKPSLEPPQTRFGNTEFDYSLNFVWDLKAHTKSWCGPCGDHIKNGTTGAILNDVEAMDDCVIKQGLGFLMVSGIAVADTDGSFVRWHRELKAKNGKKVSSSNSGTSRVRKSAFQPTEIEAIFFSDILMFNAAKSAGVITGFSQGAQAPKVEGNRGSERRGKYQIKCESTELQPFIASHQVW